MKNTTAIILNPKAGTKSSKKGIVSITAFAEQAGIPIFTTEYKSHAKELSQQLKSQFSTLVAAGGDGTINEIASELIGSSTILGILPIGSGNGLANHLGIPLNITEAIQHLNNKAQYIDTLNINENLVVNIGGFGFDGHIADLFNRSKNRGGLAYAKLIFREIIAFKEFSFRLSSKFKDKTGKAFMIIFSNGSEFGNRFIIDPDAKCNDGLFNVIVVRKPPVWRLPQLIIAGYKGKLSPSDYYIKYQLENVELYPEKTIALQCDGEIINSVTFPLKIKLNPASLKVIY